VVAAAPRGPPRREGQLRFSDGTGGHRLKVFGPGGAATVVHGKARSARKIRADGLDAFHLQFQIGEIMQGYAGRTASRISSDFAMESAL